MRVLPVDVCACRSAHLLSSSSSTSPSSLYDSPLTPQPPPPCPSPRSATQWFGRETRGPSVSPLEPPRPRSVWHRNSFHPLLPLPFFFFNLPLSNPAPSCSPNPPTPSNTDCSQHLIDTVGVEAGESRWSYTSATDTYTHTPTHALCVCAVHSPPTPPPPKMKVLKKQKEGLTDCRGGTSFITFDAVLLAVF